MIRKTKDDNGNGTIWGSCGYCAPNKRASGIQQVNLISEFIHCNPAFLRPTTSQPQRSMKALVKAAIRDNESKFRNILREIDNIDGYPDEADQLKKAFNGTTLDGALGKVKGVQKQVSVMILSLLFPRFLNKLKEVSAIPLEGFETSRDVLNFTEAVINSGLAADVEKGLAFVLGNTGVGKSSLVNTLKRFTENPEEAPISVLSKEHNDLLETRVLEIYDNIAMEHNRTLDVELSESFGQVHLIKFVDEKSEAGETAKEKQKKVNVKLIDMGGHHEYFSCSSLFVACSGVFLICFDSSLLSRDDLQDAYFRHVGTFVDLVCQTTKMAGIRPKLALVATKMEMSGISEDCFGRILQITKDHLAYTSKSTVFLVDQVLRTSSAEVTLADLKEFHRKLVALCSHQSLRFKPVGIRPLSWLNFLLAIQEAPTISLEDAKQKWWRIKSSVGEQATNISSRDLAVLAELKDLLQTMVEKDLSCNHVISSQQSSESQRGLQLTAKIIRGESKLETVDHLLMEVSSILRTFREEGEVLWYEDIEDLKKTIISRPMDLVRSLRTVISHKVLNNFQGVRFLYTRLDLVQKGILSFQDFKAVFNDQAFTAKDTWKFMIQLGLGYPLKMTEDQNLMLIPCLIDGSLETKIREVEEELDRCDEAVCLQYQFDCNSSTVDMYRKLIEVFTAAFLWGKNGGDINFASSKKVEKRKLGNVSGLHGTLKWHKNGVHSPKEFKFLILEHQDNLCLTEQMKPFSVDRSIKVYLTPIDKVLDKTTFEILRTLDKVFSPSLGDVQRSLSCKECLKQGGKGFFGVKEGLTLMSGTQPCRPNLLHDPNDSIMAMIEEVQQRKPFELDTLLQREKSSLGLEKFGTSQIKEKMLDGSLEAGEQIWVYHDRQTDPFNPVARVNPYAHVLIYIGAKTEKTTEIHEVVHADMASLTEGALKATIRRQAVLKVTGAKTGSMSVIKFGAIKASDHVFLGHEIESCQFAANIRQKIVERALKCAEKPSLIFDYDYRYNLP